MSSFSNNPSSYEGRILEENHNLKEALKWCLDAFEHYYPEKDHGGPCSPPATPCDGLCMEAYYFYKDLDQIKLLIKTEI